MTQNELNAQLQQLSNSLTSKINPNSVLTVPAWAPSQAIDQLDNVTITNANLTASEIPALDYLSLSGGTLSGTLDVPTLNASTTNYGAVTATIASSTLFSNFGTAYFGGTATSTFDSAGDLTVAGNTRLGNATSSAFFSPLANFTSAITTTFSASIANIIWLTATNSTTTNATTTNLYAAAATIPSPTGTSATFAGATSTTFFSTTGSFTNLLATAGTVSANVSGANLTATGANTPLTLSARAAFGLTVEDFGAKCDGSTDDTVAFQNAANTGVLVSVPATSSYCKVTGTITLKSGGGFIGSQDGRSSIKLVSNTVSRLFDTTNQSSTTIDYLSLDGTSAAAGGDFVRFSNGSGNDFSHDIVTNPPGSVGGGAIVLINSATQDEISYDQFINTYPANTGNALIELGGVAVAQNTIEDDYFHGASMFTIRAISGAHGNIITDDTVDSSGVEDVAFSLGTYNNILSNSNLIGSTGAGTGGPGDNGVSVVGDHNTISNNQIHGNEAAGVYLWGSDNTVVGNTIYDNDQFNNSSEWPCIGF